MNQAKPRLFVDMDGTLAVFRPVDRLETLYEEGYFRNLPPITNVVEAIRELIRGSPDLDIYVMSAHLSDSQYALAEKNAWLDEHLPEIPPERRIFPPCGADKKAYIPGGQIRETDFLLDDYTRNLQLWQPPARGIKLLNGINHTNGSWNSVRIRYDKAPARLAADILSVIRSQALIFDEKPQTESEDKYMEQDIDYAPIEEQGETATERQVQGLPDGWVWRDWDDGSGSLHSPDGAEYLRYDVQTGEYRLADGNWDFFNGYPYETESLANFKERIENSVRDKLKIDNTATEQNNLNRADKDTDGIPDVIDSTFNPPGRYPEEKYGDYPSDDEMIKERLASMTEAEKDDFVERIAMVYADYADPTTFDDMLCDAIIQERERMAAQITEGKKDEISLETHDVFKISVDELAKLQEAAPCDFKSKVKEGNGEKHAIICCKKEDTAKIDSVLATQNKLRR